MTASVDSATVSGGLRWRKADLHVHTPASHDYTGPDLTAPEFLDGAVKKGVEIIAVTDHNSGEWIDDLKDASKGCEVTVLPGVEVTVSGGKGGIHLVAIFDVTADSRHVTDLLVQLDIPQAEFGKEDSVSPKSVEDAIKIIARSGALPILAHAESSKGVLGDMQGEHRTRILNLRELAAAEVKDVEKYRALLDGSDKSYKRRVPVYRASDNPSTEGHGHDVSGVGERYSLFKVDSISLEAIRQCFCDPDMRIRTDQDVAASEEGYPWIESIGVSQGFLEGEFSFHEGLNCVVGGKGVGKSLLIEFLRFALGQQSRVSAIATDVESKLRKRLGLGGSVGVTVQTPAGARYLIRRTFDEVGNPTSVLDLNTNKQLDAISQELVPILAYSQTEAIEIARSESAQLELIDTFIDKGDLERQAGEIREALLLNDADVRDAVAAQEITRQLEKEIATLQAKIKEAGEFLKSDEQEALDEAEALAQWLTELDHEWNELVELVDETISEVGDHELSDPEDHGIPESARTRIRTTLVAAQRSAVKDLKSGLSKLNEAYEKLDQARDEHDKVVEKRRGACERWAKRAGGDRAEVVAGQTAMKRRLALRTKEHKKARGKEERLGRVLAERKRLLDKLDAVLVDIHELRKEKYESLSQASRGRLRLAIHREANRSKYLDRLVELRRGTRIRETQLHKVAESITPRALVDHLLADDIEGLKVAAGLDEEHGSKIADMLLSPENLELTLRTQHEGLVDDVPSVELQTEHDKYEPIAELSVGQKCTALVIIALAEGDRPVIIDQPEDALDIPSVYEDVTCQLRSRKELRQFILTTHNPTVAVAGDADKFHVMRATAERGKIVVAGGLDKGNVKSEVIQHLEGGRRSLELKQHKYGDAG